MTRQLLRQIVIPDYPDQVLISKARRAVYYVSKISLVKGKTEIPKSFLKDRTKYKFDERGVLMNVRTGSAQLANPKTAGTPRYWRVNFQDIWNGSMAKHGRSSRIDKLKEIIQPHIAFHRKNIGFLADKPIAIEIFLYDTDFPVDVSNRGVIYTKVIEDLLVSEGVLTDDSAEYVNDSGRCKYIKVQDKKDKKMVINILSSDNAAS